MLKPQQSGSIQLPMSDGSKQQDKTRPMPDGRKQQDVDGAEQAGSGNIKGKTFASSFPQRCPVQQPPLWPGQRLGPRPGRIYSWA